MIAMDTTIEKKVFARTPVLTPTITHYCPGCGHGIAHRILAEILDERGMRRAPSASRRSAAR